MCYIYLYISIYKQSIEEKMTFSDGILTLIYNYI